MQRTSFILPLASLIYFCNIGASQQVQVRHAEVSRIDASAITANAAVSRGTQNTARLSPDSPAPALSRLFINNVCSDGAGCETITSNELQTSLVHSGANIDVYVWKLGMGTERSHRKAQ